MILDNKQTKNKKPKKISRIQNFPQDTMANFKEISNPCPVGWSSGLKDLDTYKDHWPHVAFKIGKENNSAGEKAESSQSENTS